MASQASRTSASSRRPTRTPPTSLLCSRSRETIFSTAWPPSVRHAATAASASATWRCGMAGTPCAARKARPSTSLSMPPGSASTAGGGAGASAASAPAACQRPIAAKASTACVGSSCTRQPCACSRRFSSGVTMPAKARLKRARPRAAAARCARSCPHNRRAAGRGQEQHQAVVGTATRGLDRGVVQHLVLRGGLAGHVHRVGGGTERHAPLQLGRGGRGQRRQFQPGVAGGVGQQRAHAAGNGDHAQPRPARRRADGKGLAQAEHLLHRGGAEGAAVVEHGLVDAVLARQAGGVRHRGTRTGFGAADLGHDHRLARGARAAQDLLQPAAVACAFDVGQDHTRGRVVDQRVDDVGHRGRSLVAGGDPVAQAQAAGARQRKA